MATKTIPKTSVSSGSKAKPRPETFLTQKERGKTIPISRGKFQQLQEAWYAIDNVATLLNEAHCETVSNPYYILRILASELGEVVTELEEKFEQAEGGAA